MHLVRLMRMAKETLVTGKVIVKRPDAQELLEIRNGAWTYEQLIEYANKEQAALIELEKTSPLPKSPDRVKIDKLCQDMVELGLESNWPFRVFNRFGLDPNQDK
jgi:hypothetical protein